MGTKKPLTAEKRERLAALKERSRLKKRLAAGKGQESDKARIAALTMVIGPHKPIGRKPKPLESATEPADSSKARPASPAAEPAGEPDPDAPPPAPPPERPDPEAPPYVAPDVIYAGNWRQKYRGEAGGGREQVCVEVAEAYCAGLKRLNRFIAECGAAPIFPDHFIDGRVKAACVLTADKFLPANLELGPETELAIGTGLVLGQAAIMAQKRKRAGKMPSRPEPTVRVTPPTAPAPAETEPGQVVGDEGEATESARVGERPSFEGVEISRGMAF